MNLSEIHASVLLRESLEGLDISNAKLYIDATLGMGGHTLAFLSENPELKAMGFDQDAHARKIASERLSSYIQENRMEIIPENFEKIGEVCAEKQFAPDAILFDIGVSSLQFDTPDRGFSFRFDAPLDMRMNQENSLTAAEIVNTWSAEELEKIFLEYGEESWGRHIAKKIVEDRKETPFETTLQLSDFVARVKPFKKKRDKNAGGHPAVLVFQALRVAVNREFEVLRTALYSALKVLQKGGKIGVITFHSLEDKIVKNIFAEYEQKGKKQKYLPPRLQEEQEESEISGKIRLEKVNKKPLIPSQEEVEKNPRSRSAKLRVMKKL